jgi:FtsZ-binding cell division protein ZapB
MDAVKFLRRRVANPHAPPDEDTPLLTEDMFEEDAAVAIARLQLEVDTYKERFHVAQHESSDLKRKLDMVDRDFESRIMKVKNEAQRDINSAEQKASTVKRQLHLAQDETRECIRLMREYAEKQSMMRKKIKRN